MSRAGWDRWALKYPSCGGFPLLLPGLGAGAAFKGLRCPWTTLVEQRPQCSRRTSLPSNSAGGELVRGMGTEVVAEDTRLALPKAARLATSLS